MSGLEIYPELARAVGRLSERKPEPEPQVDLGNDNHKRDKYFADRVFVKDGGVLRATIQEGEGEATPKKGDLVLLHITVRVEDSPQVLESTMREHGGSGYPRHMVLGKTATMKALEVFLPSMRKGERSVLKVQPRYAYHDLTSRFTPPEGVTEEDTVVFELGMVCCAARALHDAGRTQLRSCQSLRLTQALLVFVETDAHEWPGVGDSPGPLRNSTARAGRVRCFGEKAQEVGSVVKGQSATAETTEYTVKLLSKIHIRDMFGDGQVIKRRYLEGEGEFPVDCPIEDTTVRAHWVGRLTDGTVFQDTRMEGNGEPREWSTGQGLQPEGLEQSIRLMIPSEKSLVSSTAKYAFQNVPDALMPDGVSRDAAVEWDVELIGFDRAVNWEDYEASFDDLMADALRWKAEGNELFRTGKFELALEKYKKVHHKLKGLRGVPEEYYDRIQQVKVPVMVNRAHAMFKLEQYADCIKECSEVIDKEDPEHAKSRAIRPFVRLQAYYRRAQAYTIMNDFDLARQDLQTVQELDPAAAADVESSMKRIADREARFLADEQRNFGGKLK
eukprot:scaffold2065_cov359-Prasinococcus_capsulatus_cf.AAC.12